MSGFYYIYADGTTYQTRARGNFRNRKISPLVGDEVIFESDNLTDGYLLEVLPRENQLVRPAVANVDQGVVVSSLTEPNFSFNLLDRFLVTLENHQIAPIIYITKVDLAPQSPLLQTIKETYEKIGYPVIFAEKTAGLAELQRYIPDKLTVLMGQSGAGKSTLLNQLVPELQLETGAISEALGRGRHTTRHVELIPLFDGLVADTPGFSAIDFLEMEADVLPKEFPEFVAVAPNCRFRECRHVKEPDCAVKKDVAAGLIAASRYENYLQFLQEIEQRRPVYKKKRRD